MKKDVFVDNNVAKDFANPVDPEYKELIAWLMKEGWLVVSNKLLHEYLASCRGSTSLSNIAVIISHLTKSGRLNKVSNEELKAFRFKKHIEKQLRCNYKDRDHLKTVLLSCRKYAITNDDNFRHDINNFPGYDAVAVSRPSDLSYGE